jgi:drug/metabolite transporter (DMT)-like permease
MTIAAVAGGVALAAGAAACFDGAVAWQALEARRVPASGHGALLARLARRRRWLAASALAALGWPLQLAALSLAPLTLVQPTLALGLVVLLVMGVTVLHEPVGRVEVAAATAIVLGVGLIAWAAPAHHVADPGAATLAVILGVLGVGAALPWIRRGGGVAAAAGAACGFAGTALTSKLVSDAIAGDHALGALGWGVATAALAILGTTNDMAAMQRLPATRVAPAILVAEVLIPVLLAPVVAGEHWNAWAALGVAAVACGALPLASATAVQTSASTASAAAGSAA